MVRGRSVPAFLHRLPASAGPLSAVRPSDRTRAQSAECWAFGILAFLARGLTIRGPLGQLLWCVGVFAVASTPLLAQEAPRFTVFTWQGDTGTTLTVNYQTFADEPSAARVYFDTEAREGSSGTTAGSRRGRLSGSPDSTGGCTGSS